MVQSNLAIAGPPKGATSSIVNVLLTKYDEAPLPKPTCFILNLPRAATLNYNPSEFWGTIENMIDGELTTVKYKGQSRYIPPPHVFILTNVDLQKQYEHIFYK